MTSEDAASPLRDAGIGIAGFDSDLMSQIEELNRTSHASRSERRTLRSDTQTRDPANPKEVPNGHRVGYSDEGDKIEWIPHEDDPGNEWALLLRRNDKLIIDTYNELWTRSGGTGIRACGWE